MSRKFKRCFITGITGSGGSYLAEHINNKNKKIKIFGTYRSLGYKKLLKKKIKKIKLYKINLCNFKSVKKALKTTKPDLLYHLAADADVAKSFTKPIHVTNNNTSSCINVLEAIRQLKLKTLIILCSTSEVYGIVPKKDLPIKENQKFNPVNPYAASKAHQDFIAQIYSKYFNLKIIITRMFTYTNPRRNNLFQTAFASQISKFEKKSKNNKKNILYHGNLNSKRCILDIYDAMEAYWLAAKKGKIGEIYNISGYKIISIKNYLKELIKKSKVKIITKINPKLIRPIDIELQLPESKKFRKHTGWYEKISFKDSIDKFINECRKIY